jgi:hypothetical protein
LPPIFKEFPSGFLAAAQPAPLSSVKVPTRGEIRQLSRQLSNPYYWLFGFVVGLVAGAAVCMLVQDFLSR